MLNKLRRLAVGRALDNLKLERWRMRSIAVSPSAWAIEDTQEVEQLREAERRIDAATGWNTSTQTIGQVLRRLRGDHSAS